jgi:hypothetical protein
MKMESINNNDDGYIKCSIEQIVSIRSQILKYIYHIPFQINAD